MGQPEEKLLAHIGLNHLIIQNQIAVSYLPCMRQKILASPLVIFAIP